MLLDAMNYAILRIVKLRNFSSIASSAGHTFRELPTPNADSAKTHFNVTVGAHTSAALCKAVKDKLPKKPRKNAVLCVEYLITASPEWFNTTSDKVHAEYFKYATQWLEARHGKENIICLNMQRDETSPHLVAYVVPFTADGRLCAKDFFGGRAKLKQMQTQFAEQVGNPVGLQRGMEGSKAVHTTNKQYNAALLKNPTLKPPQPPALTISDRLTGKAKVMEEEHKQEMANYVAQLEQARNVALVSQKARQQQGAALAKIREEAKELRIYKSEVERLRAENKKVMQKLVDENQHFLEANSRLTQELKQANEKVAALLRRIGLLDRQLEHAIDEMAELRDRPTEKIQPRQNMPPQG